jgi:hypothetical protein
VAITGVRLLVRDRALRPLGWTIVGTVVAYLVLGGKSYYALPVGLFALAVGAVPLARRKRLWPLAVAWAVPLVLLLPIGLPVLPLRQAIDWKLTEARSDYKDELGWPGLARDVEAEMHGADVVIARNYGEAGALERFGHGLPPVASGHVTFRYWRPDVKGRNAVLVGFDAADALKFCTSYTLLAHVRMPVDNEERGAPIARCKLSDSLARVWPAVVAGYD